jgi:hypothetical protein
MGAAAAGVGLTAGGVVFDGGAGFAGAEVSGFGAGAISSAGAGGAPGFRSCSAAGSEDPRRSA